MPRKISRAAELAGVARLATGAVQGVTDLAEAVHLNILGSMPAAVGEPLARITSLVYGSVRNVANFTGGSLDRMLAQLQPLLGEQDGGERREALVAALNGVLGDHLARSGNPLAVRMQLRQDGAALAMGGKPVSGRVVVMVHGLCMNDLQWRRKQHDHGELLARERGYTPVYLHYNSGRHISENGREFSQQLEGLVASWPVPVAELVVVGHSMGGLVARSACHYGALQQRAWLGRLKKLVFLGSPHHGAPLERGGNWVHLLTDMTPYSAPFTGLAKLRSAGITDLRHGSLVDDDWQGRDRFAHGAALPQAVPLPAGVSCRTVAASIASSPGALAGKLAGDGLVPLDSALGRHHDDARSLAFAADSQATVYGVNHMALLDSPQVASLLLRWL